MKKSVSVCTGIQLMFDNINDDMNKLITNEKEISRWIPVDEWLPKCAHDYAEYGEWVLISTGDYVGIACRHWLDMEESQWDWVNESGQSLKVTHWMQLPEPPRIE